MIHINRLSKSYGKVKAISSLSVDIDENEFVAILGPSGCGKSTLLQLLAGFMKPTCGEILMNNQIISSPSYLLPPEKRNTGMVFQSFALWPHMTVKQHIAFPLKYQKNGRTLSEQDRKKRITDVLELVGLKKYSGCYPSELSGGQKQRVSLARALAAAPTLLLMDEPLSALDAELRLNMRKEIQAIHRKTQATIVYVTHDQSEALAMADRIIVMNNGIIEQIDKPDVIYKNPATEFVARFVGKCSLLSGTWIDEYFIPTLFPDQKWGGEYIQSSFKEKKVYPLRPEQWKMEHVSEGKAHGIVRYKQYQGKEIHYTVQVRNKFITVHQPVQSTSFAIDEPVTLYYQ